MEIVHDFCAKYEFSRGSREESDLVMLPRLITGGDYAVKTDAAADRRGTDYVVHTLHGGAITVDAKTRERGASRYWRHGEPELALESWNVKPCPEFPEGKIGWTLDDRKEVDMILYTFDRADTDKIYLLPFHHLRMAFESHFDAWRSTYGERQQFTQSTGSVSHYKGSWKSAAVFVPASVVIQAITEEMQFNRSSLGVMRHG